MATYLLFFCIYVNYVDLEASLWFKYSFKFCSCMAAMLEKLISIKTKEY